MAGQDPRATLAKMIDLGTPFAVRTAVTLRLPELISSGVTRVEALAERTATDPGALGRLLRHLAGAGLFAETEPGAYALTEISEQLVGERSGLLREWLDLEGPGLKMDLAYSGMLHAVRTGEAAYDKVHGQSFWDDMATIPEFRDFTNEVMAAATARRNAPRLAREYDWGSVHRVVDVGGGIGVQLAEVLRTHPHLHGTLLEVPSTAPDAERTLAEAGLADRATVVPGDFFEPLPPGGEVYLVSRALSDWDDENARAILKRCAEATRPDGRVLILEVLSSEKHDRMKSSFDLQMLVLLGGRERTVEDFGALAEDVGLTIGWSRTWENGLTLIECVHADANAG